jgi:hypothetical protein
LTPDFTQHQIRDLVAFMHRRAISRDDRKGIMAEMAEYGATERDKAFASL